MTFWTPSRSGSKTESDLTRYNFVPSVQFTEIIFYVRSVSVVTNQHLEKKDTSHIGDLLLHLKAKLNFGSLELLNIPMKE